MLNFKKQLRYLIKDKFIVAKFELMKMSDIKKCDS